MKWREDWSEMERRAALASRSRGPAAERPQFAVLLLGIAALGAAVAVSAWLRSGAGSFIVASLRSLAVSPGSRTVIAASGVALAVAPTVFALAVWWLERVRSPNSEV